MTSRRALDRVSVEADLTLIGGQQQRKKLQQRALTGSVGPCQKIHPAGREIHSLDTEIELVATPVLEIMYG
jgi:hypothetical protein